jgi:hypothetical protein
MVVAPPVLSAIASYEQPNPADQEQFLEHDPVRDPGPMAAQRVGGVIGRPRGKKRGKLVPQRFQQP